MLLFNILIFYNYNNFLIFYNYLKCKFVFIYFPYFSIIIVENNRRFNIEYLDGIKSISKVLFPLIHQTSFNFNQKRIFINNLTRF